METKEESMESMETKEESMENPHKKYMFQGEQFTKINARIEAYRAAEAAAREAREAMWATAKELAPDADLENTGYSLNTEHSDQGVVFLEPPEGCDCPIHRTGGLAELFAEGAKVGSLSNLLTALGVKREDEAELPDGAKPH